MKLCIFFFIKYKTWAYFSSKVYKTNWQNTLIQNNSDCRNMNKIFLNSIIYLNYIQYAHFCILCQTTVAIVALLLILCHFQHHLKKLHIPKILSLFCLCASVCETLPAALSQGKRHKMHCNLCIILAWGHTPLPNSPKPRSVPSKTKHEKIKNVDPAATTTTTLF